MHTYVGVSVATGRRLRHGTRRTIQRRRIGNFPADHGLDALPFFLADLQTGFGPFIAVYLTQHAWSAAGIGASLGFGTIVTLVAQVPAGVLIDAIPAKRGVTFFALLAVMGSAVLLALFPSWWPVTAAEGLHGIASAMLVPAVAAVTLSRVGRAALAHRLGRNARFMALGNGIGAALMGGAGAWLSSRAPFWLAATSTLPALLALCALPPRHASQPRPQRRAARDATAEGWRVLRDRRLLAFTLCVVLFHAGNAFILPLAMSRLTTRIGGAHTNLVLAFCLIVSQGIVAAIAPWLGRMADRHGRRRVLLIGFVAAPLHAGLLAVFAGAPAIVATQLLDGMGAAMFGVLQPLVAADVTKGTNRFNLVIGLFGLAAGIGATLGTTIGGRIATTFGDATAFAALAGTGLAAVAAVFFLMPETRPEDEES